MLEGRFEHYVQDKKIHLWALSEIFWCSNSENTYELKGEINHSSRVSLWLFSVKLSNIFICDDFKLKIGDFGLAILKKETVFKRTTVCGTPNYLAP